MPTATADAGEHAVRRFRGVFAATIRNRNTRTAFYRACCSFFAWLEQHGIAELADIEPIHLAAYIEALQATAARSRLSTSTWPVRMLFDWLSSARCWRPIRPVRGPKYVVRRGKTPFLTEDQARRLIDGLDISTVVRLGHRALIGMMTYTFARIGAVVAMRVRDYYRERRQQHEMPVHHNSRCISTGTSGLSDIIKGLPGAREGEGMAS